MKISGSKVLITGASGGIGQALTEALCGRGAQVLLAGRRIEALTDFASRFPGQVMVVAADMTTHEGRDAVLAAAHVFGGLDCVINAAGVGGFSLLDDQDDEAIENLIAVNLTSTLQLTRGLLPLLRKAENAAIVNVGSTLGSIGYPGFAAYCASKFALRGFSEALRRELADTRIKVLYVAPRATRTAMNPDRLVAMNENLKVAMDPPAVVASAVLKALGSGRGETFIGWPERFFVRLNSVLPRCVDQALRKHLPVVRRFASKPH